MCIRDRPTGWGPAGGRPPVAFLDRGRPDGVAIQAPFTSPRHRFVTARSFARSAPTGLEIGVLEDIMREGIAPRARGVNAVIGPARFRRQRTPGINEAEAMDLCLGLDYLCHRDSSELIHGTPRAHHVDVVVGHRLVVDPIPVSYTHLTLPTILRVV